MGPKILAHWYVTTRCNSRCQTCSIWKDEKYTCTESTLQSRVGILRQLKALGFLSIDFTGGEPLLYPRLPVLIKEARRLGIMTWLTTNGTLYNRYANELQGNITALSFSLDSPYRDVHDRIRGIKCFDKTLASMKLAISLGEVPMIKATICKDNLNDLGAFARLAQKIGVLIELNPEFAYFGNPALDASGINRILAIRNHPNVIISRPHLQFMKDGGNDARLPRCPIGENMIVIAPDNTLYYPCMHMVQENIQLVDGSIERTLLGMKRRKKLDRVGHFSFCKCCTIPCYMESSYYATFDKYFIPCYWGRLDYVKKRAKLALQDKLAG